jgi:hypothetical protein
VVEEEGGGVFSMSFFSFYQFFFSLFFFSIFPFCFSFCLEAAYRASLLPASLKGVTDN